MSTPVLFQPNRIGALALDNRIVIPPMCQYSAHDGKPTDWHTQHWGNMLQSGAGLFIVEGTAVSPEGRISAHDLGLWDDHTEAAFADILGRVRRYSEMPVGIQLAHAGRKASCHRSWIKKGAQIAPHQPEGWQTIAPSALPYAEGYQTPREMGLDDISHIRQAFVDAARRAVNLGFNLIEVHAAHGYLLHEFLSPLSNQRTDQYGGNLQKRMRFPLEVFAAVRDVVPSNIPVGVRISATDGVEGGWDIEQSQAFCREIEAHKGSFIDVTSGGLDPRQVLDDYPAYQIPLARAIKAAIDDIPVMGVGLITTPELAEATVAVGDVDLVGIGRGMLYDPRWPWHAAAKLGASIEVSPQYWRGHPSVLNGTFRIRGQR
ncbi:NADH:flavin oxidoreductase/NADH oxidase [Zymobacter palmae]|uniref:NADH:flavinoxido reductases, Old Yellow Enzyme n=1 Tax=Zymobacter palmae TaxID=33074 RepID=A0A348HF95_9GAMM|nr:NADH:flavin oxidoreductase/NADH oxidase [Zymobacter palmae]BBG30297.1 NADH:flavinoxido reductases, Old Yellow Enzyme [Zymobacter palmae]